MRKNCKRPFSLAQIFPLRRALCRLNFVRVSLCKKSGKYFSGIGQKSVIPFLSACRHMKGKPMTHNKKRDPATDPDATIRDFVFRLRHMGYLGNIRAEFPIYTPDDVRWLATLLATAQAELLAIVRSMPPCGGRVHEPLRHVLAARGVISTLDQALKRHTSHAAAKLALAGDRMKAAANG